MFHDALERASFIAPSWDEFRLHSAYYAEYYGDTFCDLSFALINKGHIKAIVVCQMIGGNLCTSNAGIKVFGHFDEKKTCKQACKAITDLAKAHNVNEVIVDDGAISAKEISLFGYELYKVDALALAALKAEIDLSSTDEKIHSDIRDRYKSLISQSRDIINISHINRDTVKETDFDFFRKFHIEVAGRETRSKKSWDIQKEMVQSGCAELTLGSIEGHGPVAAALFCDYAGVASYAVGVFNRDFFDMPIAHPVMYDAIFRAKNRGMNKFFIGELPHVSSVTEKEHAISHFKSGFCDRPVSFLRWRMNNPQVSS